jgi:hypothetical protein
MLVSDILMKKWLVAKVPASMLWLFHEIYEVGADKMHLSFRFGVPPPTYQSIIPLAAFSLSSLPIALPLRSVSCDTPTRPHPFSAKFFSASSARVLCKGALSHEREHTKPIA